MVGPHRNRLARRALVAAAAVVGLGLASPLQAAAAGPTWQVFRPLDRTGPSSMFYNIYEQAGPIINWSTCGYDAQTTSCFGYGQIGPYGRVCSVAATASRLVVADSNAGSGRTTLWVYRPEESATPSMVLLKSVELLDIPVSTTARCSLAVLGNFIYFGTSESGTLYFVDMRNFTFRTGGSTCGNTSAITVGDDVALVDQSGCIGIFDRQGNALLSVGGSAREFVAGSNGFSPAP